MLILLNYSMTQWTKLEQSYKALQIYARQNGTEIERQQPLSSALVPKSYRTFFSPTGAREKKKERGKREAHNRKNRSKSMH